MLHYNDLVKYCRLKGTYKFVYFGYSFCPYSKQTHETIKKWEIDNNAPNSSYFKEIDRSDAQAIRNELSYKGTFPIVFVKDSKGNMIHIGGSSELKTIIHKINPIAFGRKQNTHNTSSEIYKFSRREINKIENKTYAFIINTGLKKEKQRFQMGSKHIIKSKFHKIAFTSKIKDAHFVLIPDGSTQPSRNLNHLKIIHFSSLWSLPKHLLPFSKKTQKGYEGKITSTSNANNFVVTPPTLLTAPTENENISTRKLINSIKSVSFQIDNPTPGLTTTKVTNSTSNNVDTIDKENGTKRITNFTSNNTTENHTKQNQDNLNSFQSAIKRNLQNKYTKDTKDTNNVFEQYKTKVDNETIQKGEEQSLLKINAPQITTLSGKPFKSSDDPTYQTTPNDTNTAFTSTSTSSTNTNVNNSSDSIETIPEYDVKMDKYFNITDEIFYVDSADNAKVDKEMFERFERAFKFFSLSLHNVVSKVGNKDIYISTHEVKTAWQTRDITTLGQLKYDLETARDDIGGDYAHYFFIPSSCSGEKCMDRIKRMQFEDIRTVFNNVWSDSCNYLSTEHKLKLLQVYALYKPQSSILNLDICDIFHTFNESFVDSRWSRFKNNFTSKWFKDVLMEGVYKFKEYIDPNHTFTQSDSEFYKNNYNVLMLNTILLLFNEDIRNKVIQWGEEMNAESDDDIPFLM